MDVWRARPAAGRGDTRARRIFRCAPALLLTLLAACAASPSAQPTSRPPTATPFEQPTVAPTSTVAAQPQPTPLGLAADVARREGAVADAAAGADPGAGAGALAAAAGGTTDAQAPDGTTTSVGPAQAAAAETVATDPSAPLDAAADGTCDDTVSRGLPARGSPGAAAFFRSFREPLPPAPLYAPPGERRVGLQAGHWLTEQVPGELRGLQGGASGGGKAEWEVNLDVAQRAALLLESAGIQVDLLPATVPTHYQANVFVALHADGDPAGQAHGFKVARPGFSALPTVDDRLVETLNQAYASQTALPRDDEHISLRMRYYYAFNSRRYCHAVAPGVPQAIIEMGYLTSDVDRRLLIGDPDRLAGGIADGVEAFLGSLNLP